MALRRAAWEFLGRDAEDKFADEDFVCCFLYVMFAIVLLRSNNAYGRK